MSDSYSLSDYYPSSHHYDKARSILHMEEKEKREKRDTQRHQARARRREARDWIAKIVVTILNSRDVSGTLTWYEYSSPDGYGSRDFTTHGDDNLVTYRIPLISELKRHGIHAFYKWKSPWFGNITKELTVSWKK